MYPEIFLDGLRWTAPNCWSSARLEPRTTKEARCVAAVLTYSETLGTPHLKNCQTVKTIQDLTFATFPPCVVVSRSTQLSQNIFRPSYCLSVLTNEHYAPKVKSGEDKGRFTLRNTSIYCQEEEQWTNKRNIIHHLSVSVTRRMTSAARTKPICKCYPQLTWSPLFILKLGVSTQNINMTGNCSKLLFLMGNTWFNSTQIEVKVIRKVRNVLLFATLCKNADTGNTKHNLAITACWNECFKIL